MSIRDMEMLGIGSPNDVGGTETEGTVMAKENAILEKMAGLAADNMELRELVLRNGNTLMGKFLTVPKTVLSVNSTEEEGTKSNKVILKKPAWLCYFQAGTAQGLTANITCKINGVSFLKIGVSCTNSIPTVFILRNALGSWYYTAATYADNRFTANYSYMEAGTEIELVVTPSGTSSVINKHVSVSMIVMEEFPGLETMQAKLDYLTMMAE